MSNLCVVNVGIYCRVCLHSLQIQFFHIQTAYMEISHPLPGAAALLMYEKAACFHPVHTPFKRFLLQSVRGEGCCTAFPVHLYGNELSYITFGRVFPSLLQTGSFFFYQRVSDKVVLSKLFHKSKLPSFCDILCSVLFIL